MGFVIDLGEPANPLFLRLYHLFTINFSCKKCLVIVLIEIRRLSMVSWSTRIRNDSKCLELGGDRWVRGGWLGGRSGVVQGVSRLGLWEVVPPWYRSPKHAQSTALVEIRRLSMVSWSARTRNDSECILKWTGWEVRCLTMVRFSGFGKQGVVFDFFFEKIFLFIFWSENIFWKTRSRAVDWAWFHVWDVSGTPPEHPPKSATLKITP